MPLLAAVDAIFFEKDHLFIQSIGECFIRLLFSFFFDNAEEG